MKVFLLVNYRGGPGTSQKYRIASLEEESVSLFACPLGWDDITIHSIFIVAHDFFVGLYM